MAHLRHQQDLERNPHQLDLAGQAPWQIVVRDLRSALPELSKKGIDCVIVDITAMPRICFFPVIQYLLTHTSIGTIAAVYAEPGNYHPGALTSEPTQPIVVPPFDYLPPDASQSTKVAWIPILGFGSHFVETIFQAIGSITSARESFQCPAFPRTSQCSWNASRRTAAESLSTPLASTV